MIVKNLCKAYKTKEVLDDVSFCIQVGDKIGLVGVNGCGKSTLLKILAGEEVPDSGEIILNKNESVAILKQEIDTNLYDMTILDYLKKQSGIGNIEQQLHTFEQDLNVQNMEQYGELLNQFLACDGYSFDTNVQTVLSGLRLNKNLADKVGILSGGEKIKLMLATVLLSTSEVLLLDEPTNNLDFASVEYLICYLKSIKKSYIVVSHDEKFLDEVTTKTFELKNGHLTEFPFSCSKYLEVQEMAFEQRKKQYLEASEQQNILRTKINEAKTAANPSKRKVAKDNDKIAHDFKVGNAENKSGALVKKLTKQLDNIEIDTEFRDKPVFDFRINETEEKTSKDIVLKNLICGYDGFNTCTFNLTIPFGTRILIKGGNGSGKTTLLKTLLGEIPPKSGDIYIGRGVKIGYIEQNTLVNDKLDLNMLSYVVGDNKDIDKSFVYQILNSFGVPYEEKDKPFKKFSAGQRTKINLAKLAINKVNTLVLDEPTNHLDLESTQILYSALESFKGTIIAVTHNMALVDCLQPDIIFDMDRCAVENKSFVQNN